MNITVEIKAPELANAIQTLAGALGTKTVVNSIQSAPIQSEPIQAGINPFTHPVNQTVFEDQSHTAPTAVPTAPIQPTTQQQPAVMPTQGVPTSAPTYAMDQLAVAATQLMDMDTNNRDRITQLLSSLGANPPFLMQLPKEQYGAFATKLRELGARI